MLISACSITFDPPPNTDSFEALDAFKHYFPEEAATTQFVLLLQAEGSVLNSNKNLPRFSAYLRRMLNITLDGRLSAFRSYYSLIHDDQVPEVIAHSQLVSGNGRSMLMQWTMQGEPWDMPARQFSSKAEEIVQQLQNTLLQAGNSTLSLHLLSNPQIVNSAIDGAISDLEHMDSIALPIAFLVLTCILRSFRLLIIPVCVISAAACLSFGLLYLLNFSQIAKVQTFTPALVMSILIAMSFDYSLFICTRIRQELEKISRERQAATAVDRDIATVIEATFSTAGFTVTLSGITLACSFAVLLFVPVGMIANLGLGCASALLITVFAAISIPSALLAAFPNFFFKSFVSEKGKRVHAATPFASTADMENGMSNSSTGLGTIEELSCEGSRANSGTGSWLDDQLLNATGGTLEKGLQDKPAQGDDRIIAANLALETRGVWWRFAKIATRFPYNWLLLLLATAASIGVGSAMFIGQGFRAATDLVADIPRGSPLHIAYTKLDASFGSGRMFPYKLVLVPPAHSGGVLNQESWTACQGIVKGLAENVKLHDTKLQNFVFPFYADEIAVPWFAVEPCVNHGQGCPGLIRSTLKQFTNTERTAVFGYINLPWNPIDSEHGEGWLKEMRHAMKEWEAKTGYELHLTGQATVLLDQSAVMLKLFPKIVCGCLATSFLILAVAFRSVLIPIRSMISMLLTQGFVYGLSVLTFEYGCFNWTGLPGLSSELKGLEFHMPIAAFSIIVGLCLDYDIFLLTRTMEETASHRESKTGIQYGVVHTGSIITTAGIIMAFAFGGLLFSHMAIMNQLGFFLVAAALYDTFVSRCILTPAIMSIFGAYNWWPGPLFSILREAGHG